jgi:uncharacterized membrane protein YhaH (DUF805 family)
MKAKRSSPKFQGAWNRYSFFWVTLILFLGSVLGHWIFGWQAYVQEQEAHNQPVIGSEYVIEMLRDTFENWQSEFLQLIWQVAGLAFLYYIGSPQSKEGDDRKEEKLDEIIRLLDPEHGNKTIKELDTKWPKK